MTYQSAIIADAAADHVGYLDAYAKATERAACSYFDQHIIRDDDGRYWVADEGDYESLIDSLIDRVVHSVDAGSMDG